jgi:signal transduction histidine kinase/CheY-like chemotaxis protein
MVVAVGLVIFVTAFYVMAGATIDRTAARFDSETAERQVGRARSYLDYTLSTFGSTCADWAYWNDMYKFVNGDNAGFVDANLSASSLATIGVDVIVIFDPDGKVVYADARTPVSEVPDPGVLEVTQQFAPGKALLTKSMQQPGLSAYAMVGERIGMVAARPILTSEKTGPVRGVLLFLHYLDNAFFTAMADTVGGDVLLQLASQVPAATIDAQALALITESRPAVGLPSSATGIRGFMELPGLTGTTPLLLSTTAPRTQAAQLSRLKFMIVAVTALSAILLVLITSMFVGRVFLERVASLGRQVTGVGKRSDLTLRVRIPGSDELTQLATDINATLDSLESSQRERLRLSEELEESTRKLLHAQAMESIGTLAAGIAHDFNNVLTVAKGSISLADLSVSEPEESTRHLRAASVALERAQALAVQLLTFSRGGAPVRANINCGTIVREAARFALAGSNVSLTVTVDGSDPVVFADRGQLFQVLQNIILNAREAMRSGGALRITVHTQTVSPENAIGMADPGHYVVVDVADTGSGIAPDSLPHVFDPFFTTKASGHGVGLPTAQSIIRRHGGDIVVRSTPGQGTLVRLCLPVADGPVVVGLPPMPPIEERASASGRILIMDDEKTVSDVVCAMARRLGYETTAVSDGEAALTVYAQAVTEQHPFDLVIMDLTIPGGMGGREAVQKLHELYPDARVIVSSGYSDDASMAEYTGCGFIASLAKPYAMEQLERVLRESLTVPLSS